MTTIRNPAVAGMFYPDNQAELQSSIYEMLEQADFKDITPRAIIVPHAGYIYSGEIAASAYKQLEKVKDTINRVVLLGPSHRVAFSGCAVSNADFFRTPLGDIKLDKAVIQELIALPQIQVSEAAHAEEHSLEVQLPFLQTVLNEFTLVPIVIGDSNANSVMEVLDFFWPDSKTLFVISSDLSHYHSYQVAQQMDKKTSDAIVHLQPEDINYDDACGRMPVIGLIALAKKHGLKSVAIDIRNSGDTAGNKDQVVGYGAYGFY